MQRALKDALLRALNGKPVSSLTPKPKHHAAPKSGLVPARKIDAMRGTGFHGKAKHEVRGFKNKAQTETLRDTVLVLRQPTKSTLKARRALDKLEASVEIPEFKL